MQMQARWEDLFRWSKEQNRSIEIALNGDRFTGLVVSFTDEYVELRNQHYDSIIIKRANIDAVSGK